MSTLQERLERISTAFAEQAPEPVVAAFHRMAEDLRASGILSRIPSEGDALPPFELFDTEGDLVRSADLVGRGPLVLTAYRGLW
jgi:hypothetical protein